MHADAEQLVRFDLAQTARKAGLECPALVIEKLKRPFELFEKRTPLRRVRRAAKVGAR